jgi:hypothetical protein
VTTISAKVITDSISPEGHRLTTMELRYPRFIHAELMTHRQFSRNARSSRAVPVPKMIQEVIDDPVIPLHWGAAQKGMQAYEQCNELVHDPWRRAYLTNQEAWLMARDNAVELARAFHEAGYAKQIVNRLLEPWLHIDTLVSATEWSNWFALRDHHAAEPHIQILARAMKQAMEESEPVRLEPGDWHLPYVTDQEYQIIPLKDDLIKLSVARCARISYAPFDGDASYEKELERYNLLVGSHPMHASPAEHQATPDDGNPQQWGNFVGWRQFRKTLPGECQ